ncbi:hypothetical protein C8Q75DRAFT_808600 [Abortiporus biennis]|nr:hypothetical protein C8Q75DRAFT_808600 [Abortiporus biennis]
MGTDAARRLAPPNYLQSLLATTFLITLSLAFLPFTFITTVFFYIQAIIYEFISSPEQPNDTQNPKTVLVTGARMNKALTLARAFKRSGHRVILAEEKDFGLLAAARFSRMIDRYVTLPDPCDKALGVQPYIDELKRIIVEEKIDSWVPCSSIYSTIEDAEVARQLKELNIDCDVFITNPEITKSLDDKDEFRKLLKELNLDFPEFKTVVTVAQAADMICNPDAAKKGEKFIIKCLKVDDQGRDGCTLLPLESREKTVEFLKSLPLPICRDVPYIVERFIVGEEYCTHVAAKEGQVTAFVACRSNEMLMRYVNTKSLGEEEAKRSDDMEHWAHEFLEKYSERLSEQGKQGWEKELTGHFSFDFIRETDTGKYFAIECNVRAHTAVCLFSDVQDFADAYLQKSPSTTFYPPVDTPPRSWIAHSFPVSVLCTILRIPPIRFLPESLLAFIHPGLAKLKRFSRTQGMMSGEDVITLSPYPNENPIMVFLKFISGTLVPSTVVDWMMKIDREATDILKGTGKVGARLGLHSHLDGERSNGNGKVGMNSDVGSSSSLLMLEKDPYFEPDDPLPWFMLLHVTWVWIFVWKWGLRGRSWRKVNVSTERVFY